MEVECNWQYLEGEKNKTSVVINPAQGVDLSSKTTEYCGGYTSFKITPSESICFPFLLIHLKLLWTKKWRSSLPSPLVAS